jgi:2-dehydropantoate 2-reductase
MRVAVLGSGAVGGFYGALLARAGHDVSFIARGAQLAAIREKGLSVKGPLGELTVKALAEGDSKKIGPVEVILFAVKTYSNPSALPLLAPMVGSDTIVLTLQNGVESPDEVAAVVGEEHVIGGAAYVATAITSPGVIEQTGTHRRIVFGEVFGSYTHVSPRAALLAKALCDADIQATAVDNGWVPLWEKFIYLSPFAGFTGASRLPAGGVFYDQFARDTFGAACAEVEALARAEGVNVAPDTIDRIMRYLDSVPPAMRSSLLIDLSQGKAVEVEALQGAVVRRAQRLSVPTPIMTALYTLLRPYANGAPG